MGFVIMMLGMHQDVQQKAFEEISRIQADGRDLTVEDVQSLEYLERVIKETLRLFPVGPLLFREASDDIRFGKTFLFHARIALQFFLAFQIIMLCLRVRLLLA